MRNRLNRAVASGPISITLPSTAGTRKVRVAPASSAPAIDTPSTSRVIRLGTPWWMGNCAKDVPPTWNSGIDTITLSSGSKSKVAAFMVWASRAAWLNRTPLGFPVVPEEYMITQTSSGLTSSPRPRGVAAASICSYSSPAPPCGVTSMTCSTPGSWSRILSIPSLSSAPTINSLAPESLRT